MESSTVGNATSLTTAQVAVRKIDGPQAIFLFSWSLLQDRHKIRKFNCDGLKAIAKVLEPIMEAEHSLSPETTLKALYKTVPNAIEAGLMDRSGATIYRLKAGFRKKAVKIFSRKVPTETQVEIEKLLPKIKDAFSKACTITQT